MEDVLPPIHETPARPVSQEVVPEKKPSILPLSAIIIAMIAVLLAGILALRTHVLMKTSDIMLEKMSESSDDMRSIKERMSKNEGQTTTLASRVDEHTTAIKDHSAFITEQEAFDAQVKASFDKATTSIAEVRTLTESLKAVQDTKVSKTDLLTYATKEELNGLKTDMAEAQTASKQLAQKVTGLDAKVDQTAKANTPATATTAVPNGSPAATTMLSDTAGAPTVVASQTSKPATSKILCEQDPTTHYWWYGEVVTRGGESTRYDVADYKSGKLRVTNSVEVTVRLYFEKAWILAKRESRDFKRTNLVMEDLEHKDKVRFLADGGDIVVWKTNNSTVQDHRL